MGIFDTAKMVQQAMQARKKMKEIKAIGSAGIIRGIVIDGLYNVVAVEVDKDKLRQSLELLTDEQVSKISGQIERDVAEALKSAKSDLEKLLSKSTSLEDIKNMFG
jgi:tRNA(Ser,Leu) C12 N-acetylase TAN1